MYAAAHCKLSWLQSILPNSIRYWILVGRILFDYHRLFYAERDALDQKQSAHTNAQATIVFKPTVDCNKWCSRLRKVKIGTDSIRTVNQKGNISLNEKSCNIVCI